MLQLYPGMEYMNTMERDRGRHVKKFYITVTQIDIDEILIRNGGRSD